MNLKQLHEFLEQDAKNAGLNLIKQGILRTIYSKLYPHYCYKYICLLRYKSFYESRNSILSKILSRIYSIKLHRLGAKLGFYIPRDVFGPGLYIPHTGSIIVNPNARVGKNCQINNNVVIGQNKGKSPVIGDNVFIGPGAVISGDVYIADNVWIGANAVVTHNIDTPNALVGGIPAKIIGIKNQNWLQEFDMYKVK